MKDERYLPLEGHGTGVVDVLGTGVTVEVEPDWATGRVTVRVKVSHGPGSSSWDETETVHGPGASL